MNSLWALNTLAEVNEFIDELDCDDRWDAISLVWVATVVLEENEGGLAQYKKDADAIIARARGK